MRTIIESVYGDAVADIFLVAAPLAILTILAVIFLPNKKLGSKNAVQRMAEQGAAEPALVGAATGSVTTATASTSTQSFATGALDVAEAMIGGEADTRLERGRDEDAEARADADADAHSPRHGR